MNSYVTSATIKSLREKKHMTQAELAQVLMVSDKTVSKWETGKGLPDISLLEPLSNALGISLIELISGDCVTNRNRSANILRSRFYVCPVCGNTVHATGESVVSCCGITLPPLESERCEGSHKITIEPIEDEFLVSINHPMTKEHYISFIACITSDKAEIVKLYPEGSCETRLRLRGTGVLYAYCNRDGLFSAKFSRGSIID